jgi:hypothetical protein
MRISKDSTIANETRTSSATPHSEITDPVGESVVPNDLNETAPNGAPQGQEHASLTLATQQTIPENTLHLAKDLRRDIQTRRHELVKLEENTVYIAQQVSHRKICLIMMKTDSMYSLKIFSISSSNKHP